MPDSVEILSAAVRRLGGEDRPGQYAMAEAIDEALVSGKHLMVQAGTGTGKSLGYLVPALRRAVKHGERIVVATATLALQTQLAEKDIPLAVDAVHASLGVRPSTAVLKGRSNYACLYKVRDGVQPGQDSLLGAAALESASGVGAEVVRLREWAEEEVNLSGTGERDQAPAHTDRAWQQVSMPPRECLGTACPFYDECLVELSRERARNADLVVTNHALLAIDAMHGGTALPEHDALIIDEAHELVSRITNAATDELTPGIIERAARRCLDHINDDLGADFLGAADLLAEALDEAEQGRIEDAEHPVARAAAQVRDLARQVASSVGSSREDPEKTQAAGAVREVFDVAERIAGLADADVVWVGGGDEPSAYVAPLRVSGLLREHVFAETTTVLTSATLSLGGNFDAVARSVGLLPSDLEWRGLDVGSPFDYRRQGILYVARSLPRPGRDGLSAQAKAQIAELVWAAGGRTLALFASRRSATEAAEYVRKELPSCTIFCQGDAQLAELTKRFAAEPETSLFGTLSLWQGVDVPGDTCQLVIIEKIPFPRPDDPLMQARAKAVDEAGGNGFMSVSATHAALLLAQGAGRLIRRREDRGVVAVLDPRVVTARYGSFLLKSMPGFWPTSSLEVACDALRRLRGAP
ncbi:ATP-dependent DNA helicase [Tessaracoccus sp. OH4464_COT-324]|uniref:ATP-dependent DNA helicase n=1 Tax=Tessaracoccus sp. OH4464_COT-324 TaxID=2491059 RepID=UPI000F62EE5C|nr:ATP-dependent DNA helicase [Tessaracoccus sp. OH4464_COT-324]RRD47480.1 ATP-dependent DNA helicase [Tessaracoccus sp. OH4464_COT-324]